MPKYLPAIRQFVVDSFLFGDDERLEDDTSFLGSGIIDSTGILELIGFLEDSYDITIRDEELIPENLDSVANVARYVKRKLAPEDADGEPSHSSVEQGTCVE